MILEFQGAGVFGHVADCLRVHATGNTYVDLHGHLDFGARKGRKVLDDFLGDFTGIVAMT